MGLIGEGGKQGGEETNFSSSLAEATTEQRSHQGPAGKSKMVRKEIGNGESESEELKREANGGFDKAATNFSPFLALERKKGAKSSNERAVRGEEFLGFGLKGSPAKLKVIDKGTQSHNDADHKTSMDLNKNNVFKVDPAGFGLERQHGESEGRKVAVPLEGVEKAEGPLKELGEESGRIDRGVQGQEQAAQKSGVGQMKNSPEKFARKELRIEGSNPTLGTEPKDARPETTKAKVLEEGLAHKKIEKTELNSGENSNLSSKNHSTPDKGAGAVSHSKEPHASTKSSQADILKQIVTKAAFSQETQKESARPQGLDRAETLLHEMRSKSATKNQLDLKVEARPQGFEKAEGLLKEIGEESGRINRGIQGQEQAAQKSGVGQMKGSPEEFGQKGFRTEGATQRMVAGAISHSKEPHASTKSSQADTLKQIVTKAASGQETQKESARPQDLDRVETLLHETRSKSATKNQLDLKIATGPQGFEKAEDPIKNLEEESGRINRGVQGQEQAAQKSGVGQMKGSPEEFGQKEARIDGSTPTWGSEPKEVRSETTKAKVLGEGLAHKKIEKTELNSGENSNLSSRNYSTPDKGTGAISHSKEPHHSTKSSQTDTLKQIVTKAAFNLENGRSEFKIDLKPETLGHLKMQILTENHHVTVRILTESPLVKEMIESNLVQLKVNFQNQGLEIEKFDVSVALGSDKNGAGGGRYESKKMREKFADTDNGYGEKAEDAGEADNSIKRDQQESAVNLFV